MKLSDLAKNSSIAISDIDPTDKKTISDLMKTTPVTNDMDSGNRPLTRVWQNDTYRITLKNEYMNPITHKASFALKSSTLTVSKI